jgi:uncharacterized membrane protein YbhN (UPF0104 family)
MKKWVLRLLQLALLVLVGWGIYRSLAPDLARLRLDDVLRYRPSVPLLALSTLMIVAVYLLHAWLWRSIATALAHNGLPVRTALRIYFVSSLGRYIPGKLWQVASLGVLAQREGFSPVAAIAASLVAQLAFMTTGILLLAVVLPNLLQGPAGLAAGALVALAVLGFLVGATTRGKTLRHRLLERMGPRIAPASVLLDRIETRSALGWWTLYGVSWLLLGSAFALFVTAFVPAQADQFRFYAGVVAASYLFGYILFTPAGIGVREGLMLTLLATVLPASAALLISIVSRLCFTVGELLPLLLIPLLPGSSQTMASREVP